MSRPAALIVMAVSLVLLVGAGALWVLQRSDAGRSDLRGDTVTTSTTAAPPTTLPPTAVPPTTIPPTTIPPTTIARPGVPTRLTIPELGVRAPVVPVGLEPDGAMEVPPATEAGWYLYGPRPGNPVGTAVIAAHVDYGGRRGVFFDLRSLQIGAEVTVDDDAGRAHRYVVTERFQVDKDELPIEQIFVGDGAPTLTLITCGGIFDRGVRSYQDNIVVRARPA